MLEEIEAALQKYNSAWQALCDMPKNTLLKDFQPSAVGWKVADQVSYQHIYAALRPQCDKIVETWMNDRWIAKMHLKDSSLSNGTKIFKLMQRRPGSNDIVGLDHVDFIHTDMKKFEEKLQDAVNLTWSWESNDIMDNYRWISLWFSGTEAKIKDYSVIDVVIKELQEMDQ